ncbi:hypothetical protein CWS43_26085 [Rahnella sp. AA]|uniref:hypothetical protein n=1 Tax=Rahnella sp. AA TaxID=2057180 RepID=UPI000C34BF60|nr:hypothetical protein [Rahnella sp. AA]PKE27596.1 hypothetical protein CWS43_26085 [Rahnella sp. AA]
MTLINRKYKSVSDHTFLEKVAGVFMLLALVFFIAALLLAYCLNIWFDRIMHIPAMYQYQLPFSLVLHLPAWVCLMLADGFGAGSLVAIVLVAIEKPRRPVWIRSTDRKTESTRKRSRQVGFVRRKDL